MAGKPNPRKPRKTTGDPGRRKKAPRPVSRKPMAKKASGGRGKPPVEKEVWKPGTLLCPLPAVLVTSVDKDGRPNVATVAWTGVVCSDPPMVSVSLREATHTHGLITAGRQFVVNVPTGDIVRALDYCGVASGRDVDKFAESGLTPMPSEKVKPPVIAQCPVSLECAVRKTLHLGSHTMFIGEVVAVQVSKAFITPSGRLALEEAGLAAFAHGSYYALKKGRLGYFGYSVRKRKKERK